MARLPRPHIPLAIRIQVAETQLRDTAGMFPAANASLIRALKLLPNAERLKALLDCLKDRIGAKALELHHDPALGAREKIIRGGKIVGFIPDANDPLYLYYMDDHDHLIRTNVRGQHGQHPDRVLIKKQRRRETPTRKTKPRPHMRGKSHWPKGRPIQSRNTLRRPRS